MVAAARSQPQSVLPLLPPAPQSAPLNRPSTQGSTPRAGTPRDTEMANPMSPPSAGGRPTTLVNAAGGKAVSRIRAAPEVHGSTRGSRTALGRALRNAKVAALGNKPGSGRPPNTGADWQSPGAARLEYISTAEEQFTQSLARASVGNAPSFAPSTQSLPPVPPDLPQAQKSQLEAAVLERTKQLTRLFEDQARVRHFCRQQHI